MSHTSLTERAPISGATCAIVRPELSTSATTSALNCGVNFLRSDIRILLTPVSTHHTGVYLDEFHPNHARLPADRPLFYSLRRGQPTPLSTDTVANVLTAAADTARADCPTIPARIHCHMLRKTKAMDLYQQGIPLPIIMRLLGHENTSTTNAFYAFATLDMMREAINAATPTTPVARLTQDTLRVLHDLR